MADYTDSSSSSSGASELSDNDTSPRLSAVRADISLEEGEIIVEATERETAANEHLPESGKKEDSPSQAVIMAPRAYQLEMFAESIRRNTIVVMDTGSGKTQVAILRMKKALEDMPEYKRIWFLAPTVALCQQQFEVFQTQIPSVQVKLLTGEENIKTWSTEAIWNGFLMNVKIIVATYQVLLEALTHAFVRMESVALIVFDEAHNCVKGHPGAKLMDRYHLYKKYKQPVPHILGLTASPSMTSKPKDLLALEGTLDAMCKGPTLHRDELLARVKRPQLKPVLYMPCSLLNVDNNIPPLLRRLEEVYARMDINDDPYVVRLKTEKGPGSKQGLEKAYFKGDTFVQNQVRLLARNARMLLKEIGPWAAEYFVSETIRRFLSVLDDGKLIFEDWIIRERDYLAEKLRCVVADYQPTREEQLLSPDRLTEKTMALLRELNSRQEDTVGILFAEERIKTPLLAHLISIHPLTRDKYKAGTMVGTSSFAGRKRDVLDLWHQGKKPAADLERFRTGKIDLLVATSVLEEGIDVPACNMVLCFDSPKNLKSFVQRRGRARKKDSDLILLVDATSDVPKDWESLETELKKQYEAEDREHARWAELEESEPHDADEFLITSDKGAFINLESAKQHLDHFCRVLSPGVFVDSRPDYIFHEVSEGDISRFSAEVMLPTYVPIHVRRAKSAREWTSQKNATKDAAFQAYNGLFKAGLLNDNLLPLREGQEEKIEARAAKIEVSSLISPWGRVAGAWGDGALSTHLVTLRDDQGNVLVEYDMTVPEEVLPPSCIKLYPENSDGPWAVEIGQGVLHEKKALDGAQALDHTVALLSVPFRHRFKWNPEYERHIIGFRAKDDDLTLTQIASRDFDSTHSDLRLGLYLIRDQFDHPFLFGDVLPGKPPIESVRRPFRGFDEAPTDVPYLSLKKWPRRLDLLHPLHGSSRQESLKPYQRVLPTTWAKVDEIHIRHATFGRLLPCIMHELEVQLLATVLSNTVLKEVDFSKIDLIRAAISTPSANEPYNYERLEFFGDSILKWCATFNVAALNLDHPESYLSSYRDVRVSNSRLYRACLGLELDKYILDKPFTGRRWRPIWVEELLTKGEDPNTGKRRMATKTLADVIEALLAAAYVDGGMPKALICLRTLLQDLKWLDVEKCHSILHGHAEADVPLPAILQPVEQLIGYSFKKKSLLIEALTHASYIGPTATSLERLEFIGDSVLDHIVVSKLFSVDPPLPHWKMHRLKAAMVNGDFQAFLVMERCIWQETANVTENEEPEKASPSPSRWSLERGEFKQPLWTFMRHSSSGVATEQEAAKGKHAALREQIVQELNSGRNYPWGLLSRLQARKFYSDLFESLLGAVWVDSGSMEACEAFLAKFGLLGYLDHILEADVNVTHPKEELGSLAGNSTVKYDIEVQESQDGTKRFACKVVVGDVVIAEVDDGVDREEARKRAAERAVRLMKEEQDKQDEQDMERNGMAMEMDIDRVQAPGIRSHMI